MFQLNSATRVTTTIWYRTILCALINYCHEKRLVVLQLMAMVVEGRSGRKGPKRSTKDYTALSTDVEEAMAKAEQQTYNNKTFVY